MLGQDRAAAEELNLGLRMNPRNFLARQALAQVYWRESLPSKAVDELARVVKDYPDLPAGHADLAIILAKLQKYGEALPHFKQALGMHYQDPVFYNYLGITYAQLGQPENALQAYEKAVSLNPGYAVAYLNLALQYRQANEPDKARRYYQRTCELSEELCQKFAAQFAK